jgi:hypothetical protein
MWKKRGGGGGGGKEEFNYLICESVKDIKLLIKRKRG